MKTKSLVPLILLTCIYSYGGELPRSTPEAEGVSSAGVLEFVEAADKIDTMNSFMLVRHGRVVAAAWWAPYSANTRHSLYSLSKSFTSTAVGLAIAEGKLSLDDEVLEFFPDDAPKDPSDNLRSMRGMEASLAGDATLGIGCQRCRSNEAATRTEVTHGAHTGKCRRASVRFGKDLRVSGQ